MLMREFGGGGAKKGEITSIIPYKCCITIPYHSKSKGGVNHKEEGNIERKRTINEEDKVTNADKEEERC
jgi:hypothetical protein